MKLEKRRIEKLETGLTPKQAISRWLQEAHAFNGIVEYVHHLKGQPDSAWPIPKLTNQVEDAAYDYLRRNRGGADSQSLVATAANMLSLAQSPMFLAEGPVWYRGNSLESERVERERLTRTLELLHADKLIVARKALDDE